jgi:aerobic carbon-monoxide dehydrogenase medium subunit
MKPPAFEYHRPDSLAEAVDVLARCGSGAVVLAGGQSLVPQLAMRRARPAHLVDLQRLGELTAFECAGGVLRIGAMVRHRQLERNGSLPQLIRRAARHIGNVEVRNRGTLGGSLAFADPAAEWPAVALAMDAVLVAASVRGYRQIAAEDFIRGPHATALAADELLVEVQVSSDEPRFGFAEATRRGVGDYAIAGAVCHRTTVVVFGAGGRPQRLPAVEAAVRADESSDGLADAATAEIDAVSEYQRHVAARLVVRVVSEAREAR